MARQDSKSKNVRPVRQVSGPKKPAHSPSERETPSVVPKPAASDPHRSRMLAAVKGRGNQSTELALASLLRVHGISGWRRHLPLPGRPDFAWPRERVAVFVDGCFWHGCPRCYVAPRHNAAFWSHKVETNQRRDRRVTRILRNAGWSVHRVWECQVRAHRTIGRISDAVTRNR
jgi:DNA mismatch endonuclease (patch repair protein)